MTTPNNADGRERLTLDAARPVTGPDATALSPVRQAAPRTRRRVPGRLNVPARCRATQPSKRLRRAGHLTR